MYISCVNKIGRLTNDLHWVAVPCIRSKIKKTTTQVNLHTSTYIVHTHVFIKLYTIFALIIQMAKIIITTAARY